MKRALLLFSLLLPALLLSATTWKGEKGGGFSITLTLSDEQVTIPDKLTLRAEFTHPQDYTVDLDTLRMNLLKYVGLSEPPFALNEEKDLFPEAGKTLVTFTLEPQLEGLFFISLYDIPFTATDKSLPPVTIVSDIFKVQVSLPPAPAFAKDYAYPLLSLSNRFPVQMDPSNRLELLENREFLAEHALQNRAVLARRTPPWPQVAGALLFFFLLLIARLQPKRTLDPAKERQKAALSAQKKAEKRLAALESGDLTAASACENHFIQLIDTAREFIEEKYRIRATRQTSQEFLYQMASFPSFDTETQELLSELLSNADRVKFAERTPSATECREAQEIIKKLIEK